MKKTFYKLLNNSICGKTLENLRNRVHIKLVTQEKKMNKLVSSPSFEGFKIFNKDFAGVSTTVQTLKLNRPVYAGFTVLDFSKLVMFDFQYNYIRRKYGTRAKLLFTDTDSLCYHIRTNDVYQDMFENLHLFDTSSYPKEHFLHSMENCKKIGVMKDELKGHIIIEEFCGLRSKMYSILAIPHCSSSSQKLEKKTAKGVAKYAVKHKLRHEDYKKCFLQRQYYRTDTNLINSTLHQLYTVKMRKLSLSPFGDKRFLLEDGCSSLAYGHYAINDG